MLSCDRARVCTLACQSSETWLAHGNGKQWSDVRLGCANHMRQGPAADVDFVRIHGFYSNAASSSTILKLERETREKKTTHTEAQCNQYAGRPASRPMILFYSSALLSCSRERYACVWKYVFEVAAKCIRAHCHWCSRPESQSMWCASAKSDFIIPIFVEQTDSFFLCLLLDNKVLY